VDRLVYDPYRDGRNDGWEFDEWYYQRRHMFDHNKKFKGKSGFEVE